MSNKKFYIIPLLALFLTACFNKYQGSGERNGRKNTDTVHLSFKAEEAPEWSNLFYRNHGWFGGDGIFSIPLNRNEKGKADSTLFIFSDTMVGEVGEEEIDHSNMIHNSVAYLKGTKPVKDNIEFFYAKRKDGHPESLFIPNTPHAESKDYYWLGDGFVNHALGNIYIFAYRMRNMDESDWSFTQVGSAIIVLPIGSRPPFNDQRQIETPFLLRGDNGSESATLGAGIFVNTKAAGAPNPDGYVYVYGKKGKDQGLIVSRVLPKNFEKFNKWTFWNGRSWKPSIKEAIPITNGVSNELSVSPLNDGRYALVFQRGGMSDKIALRLGLSPYGPFGPAIDLWQTTEGKQKNYFTYNAKAYPDLSKPGELLISYNVNAFDYFREINKNPHLYRPRFIKISLNNTNNE